RSELDGDVALVCKGLTPLFPAGLLELLKDRALPLVFDFDDAIFLPQRGGSRVVARLSRPYEAAAALCRAATVVLPGNEFLADFARGALGRAATGDEKVRVLPTVVDTDVFQPGHGAVGTVPVVGWVGSHSTLPYLLNRASVFQDLARRLTYRLRIVSNHPPPPIPGVDVEFVRWSPEREVSVFHGLSVGVYPLVDDHWTRGKCGFKAIQYSACGVPVVASPVGVLRDIVAPEETGLWAESDEEWCDQIERILRDPNMGARFGAQGRAFIEDRYSVSAGVPVLAEALRDAAGLGTAVPSPEPAEAASCAASPAF
ncbi:MAG: glycosyltransferase family 4 protein, partial [Longimicrobiales bacterium]